MSTDDRRTILWVDHVTRILGGAEVNLVELLAAPGARSRWASTVACAPDSALHAALQTSHIDCVPYSTPGALGTLRVVGTRLPLLGAFRAWRALAHSRRALAELTSRLRPDVVVSCTNKDHFAAWPACAHSGARSVWWVNDILSPDFFPWAARRAFQHQARRGARRLVSVSQHARQALLSEGLDPSRVVAILNGIPVERYERRPRGVLRSRFAMAEDEPLVGIVGRFTPWKGQAFFLELARAWCAREPKGRFALIGHAFNEDQPYEAQLRRFVDQHRLRERVHFVPFQRAITDALSDLDLLVHASLKPEPFGRVLIEAMAVGVPVIAARAGGVPEIVAHELNGMLATPGDLPAYSAALGRLIQDSEFRHRMAEAGRRTVVERFSLERVVDDFESLFASLP
ncbi:MAG: glycosyltransferase family 4 protein [Verrucomicrobiales bacterium]|nr:glycosyltransferase family 4 protein [Verrucomicrobiales bacterium]